MVCLDKYHSFRSNAFIYALDMRYKRTLHKEIIILVDYYKRILVTSLTKSPCKPIIGDRISNLNHFTPIHIHA